MQDKKKPGIAVIIGVHPHPPMRGAGPTPPWRSAPQDDSDSTGINDNDADDFPGGAPEDDDDSQGSVDQASIQGESGTGYEDGTAGPFACSNCSFFSSGDSSCGQPTMMARSKQPRLPNGRRQVDPAGCCEYVNRGQGSGGPQPGGDESFRGGSPADQHPDQNTPPDYNS